MSPIFDDTGGERVELGEGRGDLRYSSMPFTQWDGGTGPFWEGRPISFAKIFATQPWVAIAVMRLLTWSIRVPLKVYRRVDDDGGRVRLRPREHPLAAAVVNPWDRGSMAELIQALLGPLFVHGNDLIDVVEGAGGQIRFEPMDWRCVAPIRMDPNDPNAEILGWKVHEPADVYERSADTVMHLKWWSPLGQVGVSPLEQVRSTITADSAAVEWTINNLAQSARPAGVVETSAEFLGLEPVERQTLLNQLRDDMRNAFGGPRNAGKLPVLPPGLTWAAASHTTAVEAELIEQRKVNRNEVAAIYMLPPPMIGILDRATYSNVRVLKEMAYTDGLAPPLIVTEQKINAHVVAGLLRQDDVFVEFDFAGILRGDRLQEIKAIREAISTAALTPNEGRDVLNLPRSEHPAADKLYLPRNNLRPIDEDDDRASNGAGGASAIAPAAETGHHSEHMEVHR